MWSLGLTVKREVNCGKLGPLAVCNVVSRWSPPRPSLPAPLGSNPGAPPLRTNRPNQPPPPLPAPLHTGQLCEYWPTPPSVSIFSVSVASIGSNPSVLMFIIVVVVIPSCTVISPFVFSIYWDLDVQTNAVIRERLPTNHLPPHPEIELQRAQLVTKLRQHYHELCHQREGTITPERGRQGTLLIHEGYGWPSQFSLLVCRSDKKCSHHSVKFSEEFWLSDAELQWNNREESPVTLKLHEQLIVITFYSEIWLMCQPSVSLPLSQILLTETSDIFSDVTGKLDMMTS